MICETQFLTNNMVFFLTKCRKSLKALLLSQPTEGDLLHDIHFGAINSIFYPAAVSPDKFDPDLIWVGGDDFAVSVWSISLKCCITSFYNHVAPVVKFGTCSIGSGRACGAGWVALRILRSLPHRHRSCQNSCYKNSMQSE